MWNACVRVCASLFLPWPAGSVLRAATSTPPIATFPVSSLTKLGLSDYGTLRTATLRTGDIEDSDIEDRRHWGQATLRTGDVEDKIILKISTMSKFAKLLKFSKIVKNIGYMMQTLGGWMFLLDICCQHLGKICNFEDYCLGNERISLDICCQHFRIYVSCRVSVGPPGPWLGNVLGDEFVLKVACPKCRCPQRHVLYVVCPQCPIGINIRLTWCLI